MSVETKCENIPGREDIHLCHLAQAELYTHESRIIIVCVYAHCCIG